MKALFSFILFTLFFSNSDLIEIRNQYPAASFSETKAGEFASIFSKNTDENNPTIVGYKGASKIISAKFSKKISDKIKLFKEGAKLIEASISNDSKNIELRLIRLSVQENAPKIVKYNKNISEDKAFILKNYTDQNSVLKDYLKRFILQSKQFSEAEKSEIK